MKIFYLALTAIVLLISGHESIVSVQTGHMRDQTDSAEILPSAGKIYVGSAFNMIDMAKPNAAGWQEISNYGVGLHVHPVGWRGIWAELGPGIAANLKNKTFTYEYDIVDPRNKINNIGEIRKVESYGLKCVRALCNVDIAELDTNPRLPRELLESVVLPLNHIGIPVDILFSPVSPPAHQMLQGRSHIQRLVDHSRWTKLIFNQVHAQGVSLDIPPRYFWSNNKPIILSVLKQAKDSKHDVCWVANFSGRDQHAITALDTIYRTLDELSLLPKRWVVENFGDKTYSPVPESSSDGSPTGHPAGAALYLAKFAGKGNKKRLIN